MSDMKCPFCQQELKYDAWNEVYMCRNPNCKHLLGFGTKELWQELIRTRKALAIAVDAIDEILYLDSGKFIQEPAEMWKIAKSAKDKITALEQKEHFADASKKIEQKD